MIADHTEEIIKKRERIAYLLALKPPKRQLAKREGTVLNNLVRLQLIREGQIERRLHEKRAG